AYFLSLGEHYKAEIIGSIPAGEEVSLYRQGDFEDLCRGPHVPSTGHLKAFKLTKLSGAFWRGNSDNEMLQRIYGTCWGQKKDLDAYLTRLEEAAKRDHRKIGRQLDLFHVQEEAPGSVFWHPHGWTLWQVIEQYMRSRLQALDYQEIRTPQVVDKSLWLKSGHWDNYREHMYTTSVEERDFVLKPMNCPCHVQVFNQGLRSYRDLPLRLAEFGACHRYEPSGALHGIMRVRGFTQDDAHIFCTEAQMQSEVGQFISLLRDVYADFGFTDILYKLSTRPEKRVGTDDLWDRAEQALAQSLKAQEVAFDLQPGEGAFYGPKIEFTLKDCLGRLWQCGTIQLDFFLPGRLDAEFVGEDGKRQVPVMLHRAVLGSFERFIGILIEHYAGWFPLWLAPVQVAVLNITDHQAEYARSVQQTLQKSGLRVITDLRNEKIGLKIRELTLQRVPYLIILGDRELEQGAVAVRTREGKDLGQMSIETLVQRLAVEIALKGRNPAE
ncbi:MAG: threonine--tRNA ligase, partial [Pseudomonadales bacterium]|nr:threonine--tRNA ligase [Pseudomonadales bacterium]